MTVSIDYLSFPHLFTAILESCDQPTLRCLRMLSSAAKLQVDLLHSRYIHLHGGCLEGGIGLLGLRPVALCGPPSVHLSNSIIDTPLLPSRKTGMPNNNLFALRNTRHLSLDPWLSDCRNPDQLGLAFKQLSEHCTTLTVRHGDFGWIWPDSGGGCTFTLRAPASVKHLRIVFGLEDTMHRSSSIAHTCPMLTLLFSEESHNPGACALAMEAFKPCVQHLVLVVYHPSVVTSYLNCVKRKERHPELRLTVQHVLEVSAGEAYRQAWADIIDADVRYSAPTSSSEEHHYASPTAAC